MQTDGSKIPYTYKLQQYYYSLPSQRGRGYFLQKKAANKGVTDFPL